MKKITLLFTIIFLSISSIILAQDKVNVNAQIRPRLNINDNDFNSDTGTDTYTELRTRLGVKFMPMEDLVGFVQIQDSRVFGTEPNTLTDTKNLDLHQGYFDIKKIFNLPFNFKVGRMELAYGPQRLIGSVGWHNVGRSFDGGVLQLATKLLDIDFIGARTVETDTTKQNLFGAYGNLKLLKNHKLQPFVITETGTIENPTERYTLGLYLAGKLLGFSYEVEGAYQMGTQSAGVDIAANMLALNLNYTLNISLKPSIGAGVDYLSGDDGSDATKYKVFNTLYATNHKYYGFMDYFLNIPKHTFGLGLMDIHGKASMTPFKKFKLALAYHIFNANADYTLASGSTSTSFGSELDLTLTYAYSKLVKFVGGFSFFTPGDIFKEKKGEDSSTAAYIMAVVNL
ncbi:MAG: alginate export family protein [Bacteroidota bacterium]